MTDGALEALKNHQRQLDADGCEVGVSRQALEEVIVAFEALRRTRDDLHEANNRYQQEARDERALAGKGVKAVEALIDALAAKDAELALAIEEREFWREAAARDQAQLVEARKALEDIDALEVMEINLSNYTHDDVCDLSNNAVQAALIARLALEAQGGVNV